MTRYFVTAWCDRPFFAQCEVEAETPQEALAKARTAINDAPAEECDEGYNWDEWRVDTAQTDGVLLHLDEPAALREAALEVLTAPNAPWSLSSLADVVAAVIEVADLDAEECDHEATSRRLQALAVTVRRLITAATGRPA